MKKIFTLALVFAGIVNAQAVTHVITVAPQTAPTSFDPQTVTIDAGDTVRFEWGTGTHQIAHDISIGSPAWSAFPIDNNNTSYDLVLTTAGTYDFVDNFNQVLQTGTITVVGGGGTNVNETAANNLQVRAFPNPFTEQITVTTNGLDFDRAEVYSITGQLVTTVPANATEGQLYINLADAAPGTYMLRLMKGRELVATRELMRTE